MSSARAAATSRPSNWREHVFGYTILNDVSARDYQMATTQWTMGKNFDTFAPMGPWIVTADEIADPHDLDISLTLNGEVMQNSNTRNLIFRLPELIAFLSSVFTLEPGDVVSTGTPGGVGFARKPPVYLQPGDEVVVRVQGLGELRNPVVPRVDGTVRRMTAEEPQNIWEQVGRVHLSGLLASLPRPSSATVSATCSTGGWGRRS